LNLSASWKADVDKTVTDVELWREILANWHYWKNGRKIKKSPGIKQLLSEYERQSMNHEIREQRDIPERSREGMAERSYSPLPSLRISAAGWKG
jgi:hypothetical protein